MHVNFKDKYLDQIKNSKKISLILNGSVLSLQPDETGSKVKYLNVMIK